MLSTTITTEIKTPEMSRRREMKALRRMRDVASDELRNFGRKIYDAYHQRLRTQQPNTEHREEIDIDTGIPITMLMRRQHFLSYLISHTRERIDELKIYNTKYEDFTIIFYGMLLEYDQGFRERYEVNVPASEHRAIAEITYNLQLKMMEVYLRAKKSDNNENSNDGIHTEHI